MSIVKVSFLFTSLLELAVQILEQLLLFENNLMDLVILLPQALQRCRGLFDLFTRAAPGGDGVLGVK